MNQKEGPSTRSVHLCSRIDPLTGAIVPPIIENSAFAYHTLEEWRAAALHQVPGHIYSRNTNPTTDLFEEKVAALEGAEKATSFATGMAAISTTLFALLGPGMHAVTVKDAYGATYLHFVQILPRFDIDCHVFETEDTGAIETAIEKNCDLLYLESPTNPTLKVLDLARLIGLAQQKGAITVVDNTFATPINQSPITLGADLVIHSATKYLCGHGDVLGGVVCGKKDLVETIFRHRELTGPSLDAHSAYLMLRSLKTLGLRVQRQNKNALALAQFLEKQPKVTQVFYPGLESHPGHEIAKKQMSGFGGVLSFELKGGYEAVKHFLPQLKYAYMAANLGQVETIVGPPATTSHVELTDQERTAAGIPEGLIRYAVGIEDVDDLKADLNAALEKI
ncbi:MAG: aminotransferase class I/II-fold pyridoxal phosphate-dependent enzyme [Candidatus Aminicenantes bacterium]|nr:aminotransferase class I/II-fold pyridoxal phosphate-dependent enzyme [Candidatus Aminicenantes bacterium]NIM80484.1 aminotransferase class I/II-fold pyridoxal phosphate-dependent enzyme [Candidatus Aminicenantes bacterium]NIN23926.1 aminotransferase class I/II-fold pyridoxal phosphate-dependent enzyme [Candidatus Aminicenantes bacterium]NIN47640.1 aminotransferase class I/II-fold pyridoxal phosphate-dependent enzyme [Candidatus Aminicenantes bacterium]NIN90570.1 aminotransferase class I/II-